MREQQPALRTRDGRAETVTGGEVSQSALTVNLISKGRMPLFLLSFVLPCSAFVLRFVVREAAGCTKTKRFGRFRGKNLNLRSWVDAQHATDVFIN